MSTEHLLCLNLICPGVYVFKRRWTLWVSIVLVGEQKEQEEEEESDGVHFTVSTFVNTTK